jgi:hypothetical protein
MLRPTAPSTHHPSADPGAYVPSTGLGSMVVVRLTGGGDPPRGRRHPRSAAPTTTEEQPCAAPIA